MHLLFNIYSTHFYFKHLNFWRIQMVSFSLEKYTSSIEVTCWNGTENYYDPKKYYISRDIINCTDERDKLCR